MNSTLLKLACAAAVTSVVTAARAQIYDNGAPNQVNGTDISPNSVADSFVLGSNMTVGAVQFWDLENTPVTLDGTINWTIYSDSGGSGPGFSLDNGTTTYTHTATGLTGDGGTLAEYVDNFNLNTPFVATAGTTYWLSLGLDMPGNSQNSVFWEWSNNSNFGYVDPVQTWKKTSSAYSFQLFAPPAPTPEPITVGLGVVGLGLAVRRRMQSKSA
jgi:hypothetical protein